MIVGKIAGNAKIKKPAIASMIFCVFISIVSPFCVPVGASYLPTTTSPVIAPSWGDAATPVVSGNGSSSGAMIVNLSYDETDSDVYWQNVWDNNWRVWNWLRGFFDDDICPGATGPSAHHNYVAQHTQVDGVTGYYYVCSGCNKTAGEVLEKAYDDYVQSLPATEIDNEGGIKLTPVSVGICVDGSTTVQQASYYFGSPTCIAADYQLLSTPDTKANLSLNYNESPSGATVILSSYNDNLSFYRGRYAYVVAVYKSSISGVGFDNSALSLRVTQLGLSGEYGSNDYTSRKNNRAIGFTPNKTVCVTWSGIDIGYKVSLSVRDALMLNYRSNMRLLPDGGPINFETSDTYNYGTRTGSIVGDYGIIGDNGEINVVENQTIVNEGDHSFFNPVTGDTFDMPSYTYDYSTRTYNLTYTDPNSPEGEQTKSASVEYGDSNITISYSGNTYNVYYIVESPETTVTPTPTPVPSSAPHYHHYTSTVTTQPGCTTTGVKTYTCPDDGDTYTEVIPALGHSWLVKSQVPTTYDENGELLTEGYTVYKCSRCDEEYRSGGSESPPSGPVSDTVITIPQDIPSGLIALKETLANFFSSIPDMFGDLTTFVSQCFSFLPQPITSMLTFGVAIMILVGIFKLFWR